MSTRCNIYMKIKDEDIGKEFSIDETTFTLDSKYIGIYCHHDGYVEWVSNSSLKI